MRKIKIKCMCYFLVRQARNEINIGRWQRGTSKWALFTIWSRGLVGGSLCCTPSHLVEDCYAVPPIGMLFSLKTKKKRLRPLFSRSFMAPFWDRIGEVRLRLRLRLRARDQGLVGQG